MVQIKLKMVIRVESPSSRSFWCGHTYDPMATRGSHVSHMHSAGDFRILAQSCQTYGWFVSRRWVRHVPRINEACCRYGTAMSHTWTRHVMRMNEACHTHRWVMSHIGMTHVTHVTTDIYWPHKWVMSRTLLRALPLRLSHFAHTRMSHVTHMNESCHTNMNEACHTCYSGWLRCVLPRTAAKGFKNELWMSHVAQTWRSHVTHFTVDDHGAYCRELFYE